MKQLLIGIVVVAMLLGVSVRSQPTGKAITANQQHSVLVLFYRVRADTDAQGQYTYSGATVYASSSSGIAPVFPQYPAPEVQVAQAVSEGMNAGLHIIKFDSGIVCMSN